MPKNKLRYHLFRLEQSIKHRRHLYRFLLRLRGRLIGWKKKLLLIPVAISVTIGLFLLSSQPTSAAWYDTDWAHRRQIIIDDTKVSGTGNLSSFPVLVTINDTALSNAQSDGDDILFTAADGTTILDHEIEKFDQSTGKLQAWVEIPTLDGDNDTAFYMYWGNVSASNQQDITGTWDSNTVQVFHFAETSGQHLDSTTNNNDSSSVTVTQQGANIGIVGGANEYDNTNDVVDFTAGSSMNLTSTFTLEAWVKPDTIISGANYDNVYMKGGTLNRVNYLIGLTDSNEVEVGFSNSAGTYNVATSSTNAITVNQWHHVVMTFDTTLDDILLYVNGVEVASNLSATATPDTSEADSTIGDDVFSEPFDGVIDETRVSNVVRSPDWITTEYNNITSPNTFYSQGAIENQRAPVLVWKFDEGYGTTANDSTGNSNSGTISGATWQTEDLCLFAGKCLKFDGSNDVVSRTYEGDAELDPGTAGFSISTWFKHSSTAPSASSTDALITRADGLNGVGYKLYMNDSGQLCFGIDGSAGSFPSDSTCSTTSYADSKWHHVEGVKSGTTSITLYIDGQPVGTPDSSITASSLNGTTSAFRAGIDSDGSSNAWDGFIDEVKFFDYEQTAAQVKSNYNSKGSNSLASTTLGTTDAGTSLSQGLVGYWPLDENTGTSTSDKSGNGFTGTLTNSPTWTGSGKFGAAVSFDGAQVSNSDVIDVGDQTTLELTTFTISGWIYRVGACAWTTCPIFSKGMSGTTGYGLEVVEVGGAYKARLAIRDNLQQVDGTTTIATNTWYHIAASIDGKTVKVYVNGILENEAVQTQTPNFSTETARIGNRNSSNDVTHNGRLDDIRVYNRALSAAEVRALYDWAAGPVGWWKMDEGTGTTTVDSSGNDSTCSFTSMPSQPWVSGKYGRALNFDKTDDLISCGSASVLDTLPSMTVGAWIYPQTNTDWIMIANKSDNGNPDTGWIFESNTTSRTLELWASTTGTQLKRVSANDVYPFNTWSYVSFTWDGSLTATNVHIYVNGIEVPSYTTSQNGTGSRDSDNAQPFVIGNDNFDFVNDMDGYIDDMRVYNYIRSVEQMVQDMNAGHPLVGTPVGSPIAHWKFDEGYSTTVNDQTANNNDLTMSTARWTNHGKFDRAWDGRGDTWLARTDDSDFDFAASTDYSLSVWVKSDSPNNPGTSEVLINKHVAGTNAQGYRLSFNTSGQLVCDIDDDTTSFPEDTVNSTNDYYDAVWHHVICIRDISQGNLYLYVDGKLADTETLDATGTMANGDNLSLGDEDESNDGDEFFGDIDEVKMYAAALDAEQVKIEYNQGKSQVMGSLSINADGTTASNSAARAYCPPGNAETNCAAGSDPSPVGEWKLDERTGTTANDTSGNANTGTLTSGPTWIAGKVGSAVAFDGSNDTISLGDLTSTESVSQLTWELWFKADALTAGNAILAKGNFAGTQTAWAVASELADADSLAVVISTNTSDLNTFGALGNNSIQTGVWTHIAAVYDGTLSGNANRLKIYKNGVQQTVTFTGTIPASTQATTSTARIGSASDDSANFDGIVDHVRIYNYPRTAAQIAWDYNRGGPIGWWKLDECVDTTAYDASGNSFNGTISPGDNTGDNDTVGTCNSGTSTEMWNDGSVGKFNSSLGFDGTNDVVTVANNATLGITGDISISAWIKRSVTDGYTPILSKTDSSTTWDYDFYVVNSTDTLRFYSDATSPTTISSTGTITDTNWHHVVVTRSGSNLKFYIDGKLDSTQTMSGSFNNNADPVLIGTDGPGDFAGLIDDVRLYNYALSDHQIKLLSNDNAAIRFAPLTGTP